MALTLEQIRARDAQRREAAIPPSAIPPAGPLRQVWRLEDFVDIPDVIPNGTFLSKQNGEWTVTPITDTGGAPDASSTTKGVVKLAGDLGGTADAPTVPGLAGKADAASLAAKADETALSAETTARQTADTALQTAVNGKYTKPANGIPAADVAADVATQAELDAETAARASADSALQGAVNGKASGRLLAASGPGGTPGANTGAAVTVGAPTDASTGFGLWYAVVNADTTITLPAPVAGARFVMRLDQDATGGRSIAFAASPSVATPGAALDFITDPGAENWIAFECADGETWDAFPATSAAATDSPVLVADQRNVLTGWFHADQYGALLDGQTDDGPAINRAIVAANLAWQATLTQQTVYVSFVGEGVANIATPILLMSGVELRIGAGVTVARDPGLSGNVITNAAASPLRSVTDGAMTAGSATLTSATANFTSADVGRSVRVAGAGDPANANLDNPDLFGYIQSVTNATTAVLSITAVTTVSGAAVDIMGRDQSIAVEGDAGATLSYGTNAAAIVQLDGVHAYLRNIDGLRWRNLKINTDSGDGAGRICVYIYACTKVRVADLTFNSLGAGGVQFNGKTDDVRVERIWGTTADDAVAFVPVDREGFVAGDFGDMKNIIVDGVSVTTLASTSAVKLNGGTYLGGKTQALVCNLLNVTVRNVRGTFGNVGVVIGGTSTLPATSPYGGGELRDALIENVHVDSGDGIAVQPQAVTLNSVTIKRCGRINFDHPTGGVVTIEQCWYFPTSNVFGIIVNGGTLGQLRLRNTHYRHATGVQGGLIQIAGSTTITGLVLDGINFTRGAFLLDTFSSVTVSLAGVLCNGTNYTAFIHASGATTVVTVKEGGATLGIPDVLTANGATVHSLTTDFRVDVSHLAKANGDAAFNTNAAVAGGVGQVVSDGTVWKNLLTGVSA